jgi:hypothetical protein
MKVNDSVIYIDPQGVERNALVAAINGLHEGVIDLVYVDANSEVQKKFGIVHASDESKQENNPDLPSYQLNAYKLPGEEHKALPSDHPAFDHPFKAAEKDDDGNVIAQSRPEYEAEVSEHKESLKEKIEDAAHEVGEAVGEAFESR